MTEEELDDLAEAVIKKLNLKEIAEEVESHLDLDFTWEIEEAVSDHFANGGDGVTYEEHYDLSKRIAVMEKELSDLNFWKADRNHSHQKEEIKDYSWLLD